MTYHAQPIQSAIKPSIPPNVGALHCPLAAAQAANTAILSWDQAHEMHMLAGPIQSRSTKEVSVDLINAVPIGQTVRVDFTEGRPSWAVIRLCERNGHAYTVRARLQKKI